MGIYPVTMMGFELEDTLGITPGFSFFVGALVRVATAGFFVASAGFRDGTDADTRIGLELENVAGGDPGVFVFVRAGLVDVGLRLPSPIVGLLVGTDAVTKTG